MESVNRRLSVVLALSITLGATGCGSRFSQIQDGRKALKGSQASPSETLPPTTFQTSDGTSVPVGTNGSSSTADKPKVLVFATMMCSGCKREAELLVKEYADPNSILRKADVLHLVIGTDEEVAGFRQQHQLPWSAAKASIAQLQSMCGELPPCTVVEHRGRILMKHEGELQSDKDPVHPGASLEELLEVIETATSPGTQNQPIEEPQPSLPALDSSRFVTGTLQDFDGGDLEIESLRGNKLVVIFSGPDCGTCEDEVKHLSADLAQSGSKLHGAKIVQVFFLKTDLGHTQAYAAKRAQEWGVSWKAGSASTWEIYQRYAAQCRESSLPCTIVQTPDRGIVNSYSGRAVTAGELIRDLEL